MHACNFFYRIDNEHNLKVVGWVSDELPSGSESCKCEHNRRLRRSRQQKVMLSISSTYIYFQNILFSGYRNMKDGDDMLSQKKGVSDLKLIHI